MLVTDNKEEFETDVAELLHTQAGVEQNSNPSNEQIACMIDGLAAVVQILVDAQPTTVQAQVLRSLTTQLTLARK